MAFSPVALMLVNCGAFWALAKLAEQRVIVTTEAVPTIFPIIVFIRFPMKVSFIETVLTLSQNVLKGQH
jgi:hypothetical protein